MRQTYFPGRWRGPLIGRFRFGFRLPAPAPKGPRVAGGTQSGARETLMLLLLGGVKGLVKQVKSMF